MKTDCEVRSSCVQLFALFSSDSSVERRGKKMVESEEALPVRTWRLWESKLCSHFGKLFSFEGNISFGRFPLSLRPPFPFSCLSVCWWAATASIHWCPIAPQCVSFSFHTQSEWISVDRAIGWQVGPQGDHKSGGQEMTSVKTKRSGRWKNPTPIRHELWMWKAVSERKHTGCHFLRLRPFEFIHFFSIHFLLLNLSPCKSPLISCSCSPSEHRLC